MSGVTFARFPVSYGRITDFLSMLESVLRKKAETGTRLRSVFLLLDVDELGKPSADDNAVNGCRAGITGRNIFAFCGQIHGDPAQAWHLPW
jgi:hypothetical protein